MRGVWLTGQTFGHACINRISLEIRRVSNLAGIADYNKVNSPGMHRCSKGYQDIPRNNLLNLSLSRKLTEFPVYAR
jgi:hypothetical protein